MVLTSNHNLCFRTKNKKNVYTPVNLHFTIQNGVTVCNGYTLHRHVSIMIVREFVFCVSTKVGHNLFVEIFFTKKGQDHCMGLVPGLFPSPNTPFYMVKLG